MQGVPATMAASDLVDLSGLMDDAKCFAFVRQRRWPEGVRCPGCGSDAVIRDGRDDTLLHGSGRLASGAGRRRKAAPSLTLGPLPCRSKPKRLVAAPPHHG